MFPITGKQFVVRSVYIKLYSPICETKNYAWIRLACRRIGQKTSHWHALTQNTSSISACSTKLRVVEYMNSTKAKYKQTRVLFVPPKEPNTVPNNHRFIFFVTEPAQDVRVHLPTFLFNPQWSEKIPIINLMATPHP